MVFLNKNVAVVGGGNTAVEEALFLSNLCNHVSYSQKRQIKSRKDFTTKIVSKKMWILFGTQM